MNVGIISNHNIDLIYKELSVSGDNCFYKSYTYGDWVGDLLNPESFLRNIKLDALFILIDGAELIRNIENIREVKNSIDLYVEYIKAYSQANEEISVFISNLDVTCNCSYTAKDLRVEPLAELYWFEKINELKNIENIYEIDIKTLIENEGRKSFYSNKLWYYGGIKYSMLGNQLISKEIMTCISALDGKRKKCIVLDLDNTLWGGVIGEDGAENIQLSDVKEGARYKDFQHILREIKKTGIILSIASKNNMFDALEVIKNNKNMILREEDFVLMKINWVNKAQNIIDISKELNIGLNSIVFIDDSVVERDSIKKLLPEVSVPDFPRDTSNLKEFGYKIYKEHFYSLENAKEDVNKTNMYKQQISREIERKSAISFEDYLYELELIISIQRADSKNINRVHQLITKTNQFNLTLKRYSRLELLEIIKNIQYEVYIGNVRDKWGDNGESLVFIIKYADNIAEIDTFLMSCRVMGRYIENAIISYIESICRSRSIMKIRGCRKQAQVNKPTEQFYENLGFEMINEEDGLSVYEYDIDKRKPRKYFGKILHFENSI